MKIVAKFLFKPPEVGAKKLYAIAAAPDRFSPGSFIVKGATRELPFADQAEATLARVSAIVENEFANDPVDR